MTILKLVFFALGLNLKNAVHEKLSFWVKVLLNIFKHLMFALAWKPFYLTYNSIHGWNYEHHILMIGLITISMGFAEIFFDGLRDLPQVIESKRLDAFLLQPQDPILMIALSRTSIKSWADVFAGFTLIYFSEIFDISLILFVGLGMLFFFSLYLYLGSLRFFIPNSSMLIQEIYSKTMIIASQPNVSYTGILKMLTFSFLPVCLISLYPIQYIREKQPEFLLIAVIGGVCFHFWARFLFFSGLKRYRAGNV